MTPLVQMTGISRRFGTVQALDNVNFQTYSSTIHALVGENGAGKTTLMNVLYGVIRPDSGSIEVDGQPATIRSSREAIGTGIGMVSQHYAIIPDLTCWQNLILGAEPGPVLDVQQVVARAQALAEKMGFSFDWHALAATLSPASAQKLEILKLLWRESRIMILDEPTAMLSPADSDALYASLKQLVAEGNAVIVVTHRLPEVLDHCDHVTVLRGGRLIDSKPVAQTNAAELAELIVGHAVEIPAPEPVEPGPVILGVQGLSVKGDRGEEALKSVTFDVPAGQVVGIAGVDGNGQRELFEALVGTRSIQSGSLTLVGRDVTRESPRRRLDVGLRLIPEDRHAEGVIESWSLASNAALGRQRRPPFARGPWVETSARRTEAHALAERFSTRYGSLDQPMRDLSGGNQQRFVAARAMDEEARLILAFQPARGLDIDGSAQVYAELRRRCRDGAAALVVSFDLDELLTFCDRIVVLCHGELAEPSPVEARDRQAIGRLMVGAT